MRRVSARPPQEARRKSQIEIEQSNNRKFAKNSNAETKELTMVQSDKNVKDTPAIDHKEKIRQVPKKDETPTPPN